MRKFIFVLFFVLILSCSIEEPDFKWDVNLNIPFGNKTIDMIEIIEENEDIVLNEDSLIFISFSDQSDGYEIDESFQVDRIDFDSTYTLGNFILENDDDLDSLRTEYDYYEVFPDEYHQYIGETIPGLPAMEIERTDYPDSVTRYIYINVERVKLYLRMENNLGFAIGNFSVDIYNAENNDLLLTKVFPGIVNPGETAADEVTVLNKYVENKFRYELKFDIPETQEEIYLDPSDNLDFRITILNDDLIMEEALIKNIIIRDTENGVFDAEIEDFSLMQALFTENSIIELQFQNDFENFDLSADILVHQLLDADQNSLTFNFDISHESSYSEMINLQNYRYYNEEMNNSFDIDVEYLISSMSGDYVYVSKNDEVTVSLTGTDLGLDEVTGILNPKDIDFESEEDLDIEDVDIDGFSFYEPLLTLGIDNQFNYPAQFSCMITGSKDGEEVEFEVTGNLDPEQMNNITITNETTNGKLGELLALFPDHVSINGSASVGDDEYIGSVEKSDSLIVNMEFSTSFRFSITDSLSFETDPDLLEIDDDIDENLDDVLQTEALIDLINSFPAGFDFYWYLDIDEYDLENNPDFSFGPYTVLPAETDSEGYVSNSVESSLQIMLDEDVFLYLAENSNVYYKFRVVSYEQDNNVISVTAKDKMNIGGRIHVKYKVETENE